MLSWIANAWRVPELRRRLLFTAFVLALYRLGSFIPAPGVDSAQIKTYFGNQGGTVLGLLNLFSGNALSRFSIFALGIMPYITASIILQLGAVVVPTLAQLQKEGEAGYAKINQYTRYLTVMSRRRAGGRLLVPLPPAAHPDGEHRPPRPDRRHPHRRDDAADVVRRADHEAGRRQRHLAADLRLDHRSRPARRPRLDRRRADHQAVLPAAGARGDRRRRLHAGGPAAHPDPVREAPGRPTHDRGRVDLLTAAREHGRGHPDHLRRRGDGLPADDRAVLPAARSPGSTATSRRPTGPT